MLTHVNDRAVQPEVKKSTWLRDLLQSLKSSSDQRRIMAELRRHRHENGFQIVLRKKDPGLQITELKIVDGYYEVRKGVLRFEHHEHGWLEFPFQAISRATSAADYK